MCMTLSGHTSTLPRLVVQGHGFEASFLRWAQVKYVHQVRRFITVAMKCARIAELETWEQRKVKGASG